MKKKILFIIYLLFGLMFINSGLNKLFNYIPVPESLPEKMVALNSAMEQIGWLLPLVAVVEILGGLLFIISRFRPLGAIVIFPIMIGIVLTHITAAPTGLPVAIILLMINLWAIIENKEKFIALIKK
ncbi:MAG: DoxX family protein [Flavobacteriales bacterium]|nr:DoxX family protein [Flavobacteriales bacterium]|tara:strand:+ start:5052 stop:5432 length:381 start_codon:yes stop_codon:yes gene_type:complete